MASNDKMVREAGRPGRPGLRSHRLHATCDRALSSHRIRQCAREVPMSGVALFWARPLVYPSLCVTKSGSTASRRHRLLHSPETPCPDSGWTECRPQYLTEELPGSCREQAVVEPFPRPHLQGSGHRLSQRASDALQQTWYRARVPARFAPLQGENM